MAQFSSAPALSPRFSQALAKAFEWHCYGAKGFQVRKDGSAYIAHPLAVSTLVLENGGSEDEAIAALLHDVIEDVKISPDEIASHFGRFVSDVVVELSEPKEGEWRDRKEGYINQIRSGSQSAVLVSLADKTHNSLAYLKGARIGAKDGSQSKVDQTLWFLGELAQVYRERIPECYLVRVLEASLKELNYLWLEKPLAEQKRLAQEKLAKEAEEKSRIFKQEIVAAGFEVRHGHTTGSTNHRDWQSDNGEPWTFLIVHSSRPQIAHVSESSRGESYTDINDNDFDEGWVLGHGETEEEAWENAVENWSDEEIKALAVA